MGKLHFYYYDYAIRNTYTDIDHSIHRCCTSASPPLPHHLFRNPPMPLPLPVQVQLPCSNHISTQEANIGLPEVAFAFDRMREHLSNDVGNLAALSDVVQHGCKPLLVSSARGVVVGQDERQNGAWEDPVVWRGSRCAAALLLGRTWVGIGGRHC